MHRTQIYLPENVYHELQSLSRRRKVSLAELVRLAVDGYLGEARRESRLEQLQKGFGLWADLDQQVSSEELLREMRSQWREPDGDSPGRH